MSLFARLYIGGICYVIVICVFFAYLQTQFQNFSSRSEFSVPAIDPLHLFPNSGYIKYSLCSNLILALEKIVPRYLSLLAFQELDGESFESVMSSIQNNEYVVVLFYASWCPFSSIFLSKFSTLSAMYPQIKHIMIEQTSVLPSVFSRNGIHSIPSLLITNQTTRMKYHGEKDLYSLINFYKRMTGMDPVVDMVEDTLCNLESNQKVFQLWNRASLKEIFLSEQYLVLSVVFVLLRAFLYFFPEIASNIRVFWVAYIPHLNMEIFGESRQLVSRVLQLVDVKRLWNKMKLCKTRNFQKGARNARVWASSLASVSLGESSSSRLSHSRDL